MNRENGSHRFDRKTDPNSTARRERIWTSSTDADQAEKTNKTPAEELYDRWTGFLPKLFPNMTAKERVLAFAGAVILGIITFFAAEKGIPFLPLGQDMGLIRPFGDAILASSGAYAPAVYIALIYQAYKSGSSLSRFVLLTVLFAIRTGIGLWMKESEGYNGFYRERLSLKLGSATAFSLLALGITLPNAELSAETLPSLLSPLLLPPILTLMLSGFFSPPPKVTEINKRRATRVYRELSTYLFFSLCVYACQGHTLFGSSLATLSAIFLTVISAVRGGTLRGGIIGALLGTVISTTHAPILAVTGIFAGVLSGFGVTAAVGLSCTAGCLVAVYAYGYDAVLTYVPVNVIATALISPILKYEFLSKGFPFAAGRIKPLHGVIALEEETRMDRLCTHSLTQAAETFRELANSPVAPKNTAHTCLPDGEYVCQQLKNGFCDSCPLVCICWENGSRVAASAVKMTIERMYSPEKSHHRIPTPMRAADGFRCIRPVEIQEIIRRICESPEAKATVPAPEPMGFFKDCEHISNLLTDIATQSEADSLYDRELSAKARKTAASKGITADEVAVFGDRFKTLIVYGADPHLSKEGLSTMKEAFSQACEVNFGTPFSANDGGRNRLIFKTRPVYTVTYACTQNPAPDEEKNGDSATCFTTDDGVFYSLICDGMGSGKEASECSCEAIGIAEKLLTNGATPETAAKLTGNAVSLRGTECFTTLDLLRIDLITGRANVFKCGAACTFLLRDGETEIFTAPSMPLGIVGEPSFEQITLSLHEGDILVMISDGIAQDEEDEDRFAEYLSACRKKEPKQIAELLMHAVLSEYGAVPKEMQDSEDFFPILPHPNTKKDRQKQDDMTVTVILFEKK